MLGRVVQILAFPFRLGPTGAVATVEQGSDAEIDQQLAVAVLTAPGERDQCPTFGVADGAFSGFPLGSLQRHVLDFGPSVNVTEVVVTPTEDGREQVVVSWERREALPGVRL
jgi:hypothetical protein